MMKEKDIERLAGEFDRLRATFTRLKTEIGKGVVGHDQLLTETLVALFAGGHLLLEGVPGLGKTLLVKTIARATGLEYGRVQSTPDLMPADILGTQMVGEDEAGRRTMRFHKGPVFKNLLLVDEINRATPKTQAALLEVMQEQAVSVAGKTHMVPSPFHVLATQNPV
ncbi:MAG: AAA family ATPase, partial [Verrucomicrobiota bacterium]